MKIIKFQQPKQPITDVRYCDKCSAHPVLRSKDYSLFLCSSCAIKFNAKDLVIIPDNHISQVCAQKPVQTKPNRTRKRDYVAFERELIACRANASLVNTAERENSELASAKLGHANVRLLKKYFSSH